MIFKKRTVKILCLVLALVMLAIPLASCADKPILKLEDEELSPNVYKFLLSRMKGALEDMGYKVSSPDFWNTIVSANGTTYGDYMKAEVLRQAYSYIVTDYLFEKEGLTLPKETTDNIEELMDKLVKRAGSKTALNSELSAFGANYKILKGIYTTEAKMTYLKEYYFGADGEKISVGDKDDYLNENYVSFKQVFLAGYYYLTETDEFNNTVYFVKTEDTSKREIAYDKVNGSTKIDEFGKPIEDKYGNPVYFDADGNIAYDKVNGVVSYIVNDKDERVTEFYSKEELAAIKSRADALAGKPYTAEEFEALMKSDSDEEYSADPLYLFVSPSYYFNQSSDAKYLDDIAKALSEMEIGQTRVVESDYGYHIIYKYKNESGAYESEKHEKAFATFTDDLIDMLFDKLCDEYESRVVYDKAAFDRTPSMIEIASNTLY